jgi:glycosyltransferase involved in cell wall biosynthesis
VLASPALQSSQDPAIVSRLPISVLITTFNEERNLADCLASVAWADERIVVDSFSRDGTAALARSAGATVLEHAYVSPSAQKNWAIPQCAHRWVLILDADERALPDLCVEIQALLAQSGGPPAAAYEIRRRTVCFGSELKYCGLQRDRVTRFFDRTRARYDDREVHEEMIVDGPVRCLDGRLLHLTYRTFDDYLEKFSRYTTWSANELWKSGKRTGWWKVWSKPLSRFIAMYVLRLGFLDGVAGLIYCGLGAAGVFVRHAKLWAMQRAVARDARWPDGERIIHAGAAIRDQRAPPPQTPPLPPHL